MRFVWTHVDGGDVVALGDRGAWNVAVKLAENLVKPNALGHSVRHSPVFGLRA
jgi:hypothetical protein